MKLPLKSQGIYISDADEDLFFKIDQSVCTRHGMTPMSFSDLRSVATLIVRAVNMHDKLVELARSVELATRTLPGISNRFRHIGDEASAILKELDT